MWFFFVFEGKRSRSVARSVPDGDDTWSRSGMVCLVMRMVRRGGAVTGDRGMNKSIVYLPSCLQLVRDLRVSE